MKTKKVREGERYRYVTKEVKRDSQWGNEGERMMMVTYMVLVKGFCFWRKKSFTLLLQGGKEAV